MNTHSRNSDSRMEIFVANALKAGVPPFVLLKVLEAVTTEDGLSILKKEGYMEQTMHPIMEKINFYLNNRAYGNLEIGVLLFSNVYGELGRCGDVEGLLECSKVWMEEE